MTAFTRLATQRAGTKRATLSSGKSAGAVAHLAGVACVPLAPVDAETRNRADLQSFAEVKETFVASGLDIVEGDLLTIGAVDYPIRAVEEWAWRPGAMFLRLIVEVLKR